MNVGGLSDAALAAAKQAALDTYAADVHCVLKAHAAWEEVAAVLERDSTYSVLQDGGTEAAVVVKTQRHWLPRLQLSKNHACELSKQSTQWACVVCMAPQPRKSVALCCTVLTDAASGATETTLTCASCVAESSKHSLCAVTCPVHPRLLLPLQVVVAVPALVSRLVSMGIMRWTDVVSIDGRAPCTAGGCVGVAVDEAGMCTKGHVLCASCGPGALAHPGLTCPVAAAVKTLLGPPHAAETACTVRQCPECSGAIAKGQDCMHITHSEHYGGCGADFCWGCGAKMALCGIHMDGYRPCTPAILLCALLEGAEWKLHSDGRVDDGHSDDEQENDDDDDDDETDSADARGLAKTVWGTTSAREVIQELRRVARRFYVCLPVLSEWLDRAPASSAPSSQHHATLRTMTWNVAENDGYLDVVREVRTFMTLLHHFLPDEDMWRQKPSFAATARIIARVHPASEDLNRQLHERVCAIADDASDTSDDEEDRDALRGARLATSMPLDVSAPVWAGVEAVRPSPPSLRAVWSVAQLLVCIAVEPITARTSGAQTELFNLLSRLWRVQKFRYGSPRVVPALFPRLGMWSLEGTDTARAAACTVEAWMSACDRELALLTGDGAAHAHAEQARYAAATFRHVCSGLHAALCYTVISHAGTERCLFAVDLVKALKQDADAGACMLDVPSLRDGVSFVGGLHAFPSVLRDAVFKRHQSRRRGEVVDGACTKAPSKQKQTRKRKTSASV